METESNSSNYTSISQRLRNKSFGTRSAISLFCELPEETSHSKCQHFLRSPYLSGKEACGYRTSRNLGKENFNIMKENIKEEANSETLKVVLAKRKLLFKKIDAVLEDAPDRNSILDKLFETIDELDANMSSDEINETSKEDKDRGIRRLLAGTQESENDLASESDVSMLVNITEKQENNKTKLSSEEKNEESTQDDVLTNLTDSPEITSNPGVSGLRRKTRSETISRRSSVRLRDTSRRVTKSKFEDYLQVYYVKQERKKVAAESRKNKRKQAAVTNTLNVRTKRRKLFTMDMWLMCMPEEIANGS